MLLRLGGRDSSRRYSVALTVPSVGLRSFDDVAFRVGQMNGMLVGPYHPSFGAPPMMGNQGMGMYLQQQQDQQAQPWGQPVPTGAGPMLWGEQSHGLGQQQLEPLNEMFLPSSEERVSRPPTPRAQIAPAVCPQCSYSGPAFVHCWYDNSSRRCGSSR